MIFSMQFLKDIRKCHNASYAKLKTTVDIPAYPRSS